MCGSRHVWALVLAAGDGARIAAFTQDASGRAVPKQYCSFGAPVSLLRRTVDRAARMVAGDRVADRGGRAAPAVVGGGSGGVPPSQHRDPTGEQGDGDRPPARRHARLAAGSKRALHRLSVGRLRRGRGRPPRRCGGGSAGDALGPPPHRAAGDGAGRADPEYGWIVCGRPSATGVREVLSFREKPDRDTAALLRKRGALVNSFILVGTGATLVELFEQTIGNVVQAFRTPGLFEDGESKPSENRTDGSLLATSLVTCWSPRRRGSRWWPSRPADGLTWERPRGS